MKGPETHRITYVVVPVLVRCPELCDDPIRIAYGDDGDPGAWGDTWVQDGDEGYWEFNPWAQQAGSEFVAEKLRNTAF